MLMLQQSTLYFKVKFWNLEKKNERSSCVGHRFSRAVTMAQQSFRRWNNILRICC